MPSRVAVVGASAAGLTAAETLRRRGFDGQLTLIGDEPRAPYDRPPLSKQVLSGAWEPGRVMLRPDEELTRLDADMRLGRTAAALNMADRQIKLDDGGTVEFDGLIIATGVRPRRLPGSDLTGVHVLRTLEDSVALRAALLTGPRVVVVGAGFLGTEVAATARVMGLEVTVAEPQPLPVGPLGGRIGDLVVALHHDNGTRMRCGVPVRRLHDAGGRVTGVELADGTLLSADVVVLAVGAAPATSWLSDSGLALGNGVECDNLCQAAPGVYAAGDIASWFNPRFGRRMRLEHRMNATEQAIAAAGNLLGDRQPFSPVPYFWTDQYDAKIQAYGVFPGGAEVRVVHGDPAERRFAAVYGHQGRVTGVLGWNTPRQLHQLRPLVADRVPWASLASAGPLTGHAVTPQP